MRVFSSLLFGALLAGGCASTQIGDEAEGSSDLTTASGIQRRLVVDGTRLVDPATKESVTLRGVNLAGNAKLPPFLPFRPNADGQLDVAAIEHHFELLGGKGFNSIRLTLYWEAYEAERGRYDETYLGRLVEVAKAASRKNLYVIVDIHQDLFSRHAGRGCGSGFPRWTVPERYRAASPLNPGVGCGGAWPNEVVSGTVTESFASFYRNEDGVRDAYLDMLERVMARMKDVPGVLGIDPLNEPIYNIFTDVGGEGMSELGSLYRDAAERVRSVFPDATMFLEGHIWTNNGGVFINTVPGLPAIGVPVTLPKPSFGNVVYAPHVYHVDTMGSHRFDVANRDQVFSKEFDTLESVGRAWNAPVWIGEFGIHADTESAPEYFDTFYARMNRMRMHGAVWNDSPHWGQDGFTDDGWNSEDLSLFDGRDQTFRSFYRGSAYVERVAGASERISDTQDVAGGPRTLVVAATVRPEDPPGTTVIFLPKTPSSVTGSGTTCRVGTTASGGRALLCDVRHPGSYAVSITY